MGGFGDLGEEAGFGEVIKVNLGRKWVEPEDEGKSSCEKLRVVLAILLVLAVCQNTPSYPFRYPKPCKSTEHRIFGPPEYIPTPPFGRPPRFGGPSSKLYIYIYIYTCSDKEDRKAPKGKRRREELAVKSEREKERGRCPSF